MRNRIFYITSYVTGNIYSCAGPDPQTRTSFMLPTLDKHSLPTKLSHVQPKAPGELVKKSDNGNAQRAKFLAPCRVAAVAAMPKIEGL